MSLTKEKGMRFLKRIGLIHYNLPGTLEQFLDYAKDTGFNCAEIQCSDIWIKGASADEAKKHAETVRGMLDARGLTASGLAAMNDFVVDGEDEIKAQVERMSVVCQLADIIGTKVLRTDGGWPKASVPEEKYFGSMLECFKRCMEFVEPGGYLIALDNHGTVTNDANLQIELFEKVGSKNMGANLDTMNYRWFGHDLDTIKGFYKKIAPYVMHTHFKDGKGSRNQYVGTALGEGELDLDYAIACLKEVGYAGPWLVEYEGSPDPREGYRKGLEWLKARV